MTAANESRPRTRSEAKLTVKLVPRPMTAEREAARRTAMEAILRKIIER